MACILAISWREYVFAISVYVADAASDSQLALAIVTGVKSIILESPRFVRHQNELASTLAGIPPSAAAARGLVLLRSLLAASPPLDAPIIFLPQQRSMYLIQQMQAWLSSAVELPLGVHSSLAELFAHLAPIIQELSGSHWEMFFDVIEYNLLSADWDESDSLPGVWRACKLLEVIKGLAESNKELGGNVKTRMEESLALVRDLFVSRPGTDTLSCRGMLTQGVDSRARHTPRTMILDAMARLMPDLPAKLLEMGPSFDKVRLAPSRIPMLTLRSCSISSATRPSRCSSLRSSSSDESRRSTSRTSWWKWSSERQRVRTSG